MRRIIATYEMIRGYKNRATNYWLAISEFIDNSIASYVDNNRNNSVEGLKVEITFDYRQHDNCMLVITDNAKGMDSSKLEEAMQPNQRTGKSDTQYNQYGVGMKLGMFWYGEDATVISKTPRGHEHLITLNTHGASVNTAVEVEARRSKLNAIKYDSGTTVIVSHLYDNRCQIKYGNEKYKHFIWALGCRYSRLLDSEEMQTSAYGQEPKKGMKLLITIKEESGNVVSELVQPYFSEPFVIAQFKDKNLFKNDVGTNWSITEKTREEQLNRELLELDKKLEEKIKNPVTSSYVEGLETLYGEAYEKFVNNSPLLFERNIRVNDHWVKLDFGVLSFYDEYSKNVLNKIKRKSFSKYSGVTIYHMDRAIMHGPNDTGTTSTKQFTSTSKGSTGDPKWRRMYGYLDLTGVETPDENKSKFDWSPTGESDLEEALKKIYMELEPILAAIIHVQEVEPANINTEKDYQEICNTIKKAIDIQNLCPSEVISKNNENALPFTLNILGEKYEILVFEDYKSTKFIDWKMDPSENLINVHIAADNPIWKPFINNVEFKGKLLYPIVLILSIGQLVYNDDSFIEEFNIDENSKFIDVINKLIEEFIK